MILHSAYDLRGTPAWHTRADWANRHGCGHATYVIERRPGLYTALTITRLVPRMAFRPRTFITEEPIPTEGRAA